MPGSVTVLFIMVRADISLAYPILYQLLYLLDSVLLVFLWNMAGDLFNARQGKRIFPLVTASQVLGTTIGSFVTGPLTLVVGQDPTLLIFGTVCLGTAIFLGRTGYNLLGGTNPMTGGAKGIVRAVPLTEVPSLMQQYPNSALSHNHRARAEYSPAHILLPIQYYRQ